MLDCPASVFWMSPVRTRNRYYFLQLSHPPRVEEVLTKKGISKALNLPGLRPTDALLQTEQPQNDRKQHNEHYDRRYDHEFVVAVRGECCNGDHYTCHRRQNE